MHDHIGRNQNAILQSRIAKRTFAVAYYHLMVFRGIESQTAITICVEHNRCSITLLLREQFVNRTDCMG